MPDLNEQMRAFEVWAKGNGFGVSRRNDPESPDTYFNYETEQRWITWQAARRQHGSAPNFEAAWAAEIAANGDAEIGADYRHWMLKGWHAYSQHGSAAQAVAAEKARRTGYGEGVRRAAQLVEQAIDNDGRIALAARIRDLQSTAPPVATQAAQAVGGDAFVALFESVIRQDPAAFTKVGETTYQVTRTELLELAMRLPAPPVADADDEQRVWIVNAENGDHVMMCPAEPSAETLALASVKIGQSVTATEYLLRPSALSRRPAAAPEVAAEQPAALTDGLFSVIRAFGYTTSGQTAEIVEAIEQHLRAAGQSVVQGGAQTDQKTAETRMDAGSQGGARGADGR